MQCTKRASLLSTKQLLENAPTIHHWRNINHHFSAFIVISIDFFGHFLFELIIVTEVNVDGRSAATTIVNISTVAFVHDDKAFIGIIYCCFFGSKWRHFHPSCNVTISPNVSSNGCMRHDSLHWRMCGICGFGVFEIGASRQEAIILNEELILNGQICHIGYYLRLKLFDVEVACWRLHHNVGKLRLEYGKYFVERQAYLAVS